ncbi:MAG: hypothetical protein H0V85_06980 [Thermoleophilaceae bacterium]|nr:hypothetical protein [Thermoleophilaceae bacterium]
MELLPLAVLGGSWWILAAVIVILVGLIVGFFTVKGSGISETPYGKMYGGAPGAHGKSSASGKDERASERDWSRGAR